MYPPRWRVFLVLAALCSGCEDLKTAPPATEDAGPAADGGDDEGTGDSSPTRFCERASPEPQFCADFDEGKLTEGFENAKMTPDPSLGGGGKIEADTNQELAKDGTRSVVLSTPSLIGSKNIAKAFLMKEVPVVPKNLAFSADTRLVTEELVAGGGRVALLNVEWDRPGTGGPGAFMVLRSATGMTLTVFDELKALPTVVFTQQLPVGQWKEFSFLLYNHPMDDEGNGRLDIFIDKVLAASAPVPASYQTTTVTPLVSYGIPLVQGPTGAFKLNVDNVQLRWK